VSARTAQLAVTCVLALALAPSCRRASPSAPAIGPRLQLAQPHHDFGAVLQYDDLSEAFPLENRGDAPLEISAVEAGHECQTTTTSLRIAPNASAKLDVHCRPVHYGAFLSTLSFHCNDAQQPPSVVLELKADVTPLLASDQPLIAFELPFGTEQSEDLHFRGARAAVAKLQAQAPPESGLSVQVLQNEGVPTLRIRAQGKPVGTRAGMLTIATGLEQPAEISLPWSCRVLGTLTLSPTNPYFDLLAPGGNRVSIDVSSIDAGFRVRSVRVTEGPFNATFAPAGAPGHYSVTVALDEQRSTPGARGAIGKLLIQSTDHSEPHKEVELFAFGSADAGVGGSP
jgi:hypothetical protein